MNVQALLGLIHRLSSRTLLFTGVVIIAVAIVSTLIPLHLEIADLSERRQAREELREWMKASAGEIEQLRLARPVSRQTGRYSSLISAIDKITVQLKMRQYIRRIDPNGDRQAQVWVEAIHFDNLIHLLNIFQRDNAISVASISVARRSDDGSVDARLVLVGDNNVPSN